MLSNAEQLPINCFKQHIWVEAGRGKAVPRAAAVLRQAAKNGVRVSGIKIYCQISIIVMLSLVDIKL